MSNTYAVIENGTVVNVVLWDGESDWSPDIGIAVPAGDDVGIGWSYKKGKFTPPPSPPLTPESIAAKNMAMAQAAYNLATAKITALNEQIADDDYTGTTEDEVNSELISWTDYRKNLRAYLKTSDGSKDLPDAPE